MPDPTILKRLHPEFAPLLEQFAVVPETEPTLDETRAMYRMLQPAAPEIEVGDIIDAVIPGPVGPLKVRHYVPAGKGPHPVIVHYHGGGFVMGDLDTHDAQCRILCRETGCIVTAVDYRLGPEHPYPAAHDDAFAAVRWAAKHAGEIGGDVGRIGLAGDSAGGHLVLCCALRAKREGGPKLQALLAVVPAVVFGPPLTEEIAAGRETRNNSLLGTETMDGFTAAYFQDPADPSDPALNLLGADLSGLPPTIIAPAEVDVLHDEGVEMAKHLTKAGVKTQLMVGEGMAHIYFSVSHVFPAAAPYVLRASQAMGKLMKG